METKEIKLTSNDKIILDYIIKITKMTGTFVMSNHTIALATDLTESQVQTSINKLVKYELINKYTRARVYKGSYSGMTRTITINNNNLKTI